MESLPHTDRCIQAHTIQWPPALGGCCSTPGSCWSCHLARRSRTTIGISQFFRPPSNPDGFVETCLTYQRVKSLRKGCFSRPPEVQGFQLPESSSQIPIVDFLSASRKGAYFRKPYFGFLARSLRISGDFSAGFERACSGRSELLVATARRSLARAPPDVAAGQREPACAT